MQGQCAALQFLQSKNEKLATKLSDANTQIKSLTTIGDVAFEDCVIEIAYPFSWRLTENGSCRSVKFYLLPLVRRQRKGKDQNIQKQTTSEHFSWRFLP